MDSTDKSKFKNVPYVKRVEKPWGHDGQNYPFNEGKRLSLQVHDQKQESWFLMSGRAKIIWEDEKR